MGFAFYLLQIYITGCFPESMIIHAILKQENSKDQFVNIVCIICAFIN